MATHKSKRRQSLYNLLSKQVNVAVEGELAKSRAALLVWFLSVVKGFDEADAVEFICDGDGDGGIDGLLMETHETDDGNRYVVTAFQSKYPHQPSMVGEKEIAEFIARGERLQNVNSLRLLVEPSDREELRRLVERFRLEEKIEDGTVTFKLHFVTAGHAGGEARKLVEAHNHSRPDYVKVWDIDTLGPAIESYSAVAPAANVVCVPVSKSERLLVQASDYRTSVAAVRAQDIVQWPGIEDRSLFNLNVRRQLPANRVRSALDRATTRQIEHDRFLASHNGITVICRLLEVEADRIVMHDPSVVNGAQSIIAFFDNQDALTNQLKVFVKICELDPRTPFARDIAIRSNTQSAVNSRNLRALDGPQLRLTDEFKSRFPDITYETRPDKSLDSSHSIIQNHQAARCLCAVMNRRPWLAIKNLSLFDDPNYAAIFNEDVHAEQVFFCSTIRELVDEDRDRFPASYRRSWVLTSIIATYLAAEALRALRNDEDLHSLAEAWVEETEVHQKDIEIAIDAARKTLELRRDDHQLNDIVDDFKVDFKNEGVLRKLGGKAREVAIILRD